MGPGLGALLEAVAPNSMRETECLVNLDASSSNSCRTFPPEVVHRLARPIREESVVHHTRLRHNSQYVLSPLRSPKVPDREWHTRTRRQEGRMARDFSCVAIIPVVLPSHTFTYRSHATIIAQTHKHQRHARAPPHGTQQLRVTSIGSSSQASPLSAPLRCPYNTPIGRHHLLSHLTVPSQIRNQTLSASSYPSTPPTMAIYPPTWTSITRPRNDEDSSDDEECTDCCRICGHCALKCAC